MAGGQIVGVGLIVRAARGRFFKLFVDTNIFVYSFDSSAKKKQRKAKDVIAEALAPNSGIISFQVIQEFLNVATRKFRRPLTVRDSKFYLDRVLFPLCEIFPNESLYATALDITSETQYTFYDSLILAAASAGNCKMLYSEDLCHERIVRGVTIINPFQ